MSPRASTQLVAGVSQLIAEFCRTNTRDPDIVSRFHMAAQELGENLVKYSVGNEVRMEVCIVGDGDQQTLTLRATNQGTAEQLSTVASRLAAIVGAEDPAAHYDRLIRETAPREEGSGLGLARLRAEGDLNIDYWIEGDRLTISVHSSISPRKEPRHVSR